MKKIFYPVLLLVLAACKNPEQTSETIVPAPAIADIPTDTVTTQVDGITSATSKPNKYLSTAPLYCLPNVKLRWPSLWEE